jgi:amidase
MLPPPDRPFVEEVGRDPQPLRVGVLAASPVGTFQPEATAARDAAAGLLQDLGHEIVEVEVELGGDVVASFELLWAALVAGQPVPHDTLEPVNRWLVGRGEAATAAEYIAAEFAVNLACRALVARFHGEFDVLALPVLTRLPLQVGEFAGLPPGDVWDRVKDYVGMTPLVNATGQPAACIPLHWDPDTGLPVGVQVVGRLADEAVLFRLSGQLERARPWSERRPPGHA